MQTKDRDLPHAAAPTRKHTDRDNNAAMPAVLAPTLDAPPVETRHGTFDLDDPVLPRWIDDNALASDGYPYARRMKNRAYESTLQALQIELVKLQRHIVETGARIAVVMEGRDAAGKGGAIGALRRYMSRRTVRMVALPKPNDRERGQWYFQRYVDHLPTRGEMVLFDRSWYNRAGVEPVMGFCTPEEAASFLDQAPEFERMLVQDGILLFKFWLSIGRETQLKRFHARRHNPLKIWKLSPIDYVALEKFDAYSEARDRMFAATHTPAAPWSVVLANDKRRARINIARHILTGIDYPGRDADAVGAVDQAILAPPVAA